MDWLRCPNFRSKRQPPARFLQPAQCKSARSQRAPRTFFLQPSLASPERRPQATSFYETKLKRTLERLVDFDRINAGTTRFSVGAVNVRTGNFVYFDNETHTIPPEHVMASGALPPRFPAVEIEGEFYWDGGLVSNTPLQWVVEQAPARTRSPSRWTSGTPTASFPAIWRKS